MKKLNRAGWLFVAMVALFVASIWSGCSALEGGLLQKQETVRAVVTEQPPAGFVIPNPISKAGSVLEVTQPQLTPTNFVKPYFTAGEAWRETNGWVRVTNFVTNTVFVPKPELVQTIETARAGSVFVPPPYGQMLDLGLGALAAGLAWYARRKTVHANDASAEADTANTIVRAVIRGVEAGTTGTEAATAQRIKDAINAASKELAVADPLHQAVKEYTKS